MSHTLKICKGEGERSFHNPSSKALNQAIDALKPVANYYAVLESNPPVEKCAYVQALIEREGKYKGRYLVEARYLFPGYFKHYRMHTKDVGEMKRVFEKFAGGTAPNVAGWEDFSERMAEITT